MSCQRLRYIRIPSLVLLLVVSLAVGGCIERKPERLARRESPVTADLKDMAGAQADMQADSTIDPETYKRTLIVFRNRVYDYTAQALVREAEDLYRAATILLECDIAGGDADCLLAFYMAKTAADKGMEEARYLAARSIDRHMVTHGKLQRFGTQEILDSLGGRTLAPFDPNTSDSERAAWGVPPLEELMPQGATE
ncbi:hypothetical protein GF377_08780 [candidate division GN15 bacterium]|nr:hypothetical protein [candidate division GN15 bacterium]